MKSRREKSRENFVEKGQIESRRKNEVGQGNEDYSRWSNNKEEVKKQNMYNQKRRKDKDEKRGGR